MKKMVPLCVSLFLALVFLKVLFWLVVAAFAVIFPLLLRSQREQRYLKLKDEFETEADQRQKQLGNAYERYTNFESDRDSVKKMTGLAGETKVLYDQATNEIDEIFLALRALSDHLTECRNLAATATVSNPEPLRQASDKLDEEFEFETGKVDLTQLFSKPQEVIKVHPKTFLNALAKRYKQAMESWQSLLKAVSVQSTDPQDAFKAAGYQKLQQLAAQWQIPEQWLEGHPLHQQDQVVFYQSLRTLQMSDPVKYAQRLTRLEQSEEQISKLLDEVVQLLKYAAELRDRSIEIPAGTQVQPNSDPKQLRAKAMQAEGELKGLLATQKNVDHIRRKAELVHELYSLAIQQAEQIKHAFQTADSCLKQADQRKQTALRLQQDALKALQEAKRQHSAKNSFPSLEAGDQLLKQADATLGQARQLLGQVRHLEANQVAEKATAGFRSAAQSYEQVVARCKKLDTDRADLERRIANIPTLREQTARRVRDYGRQRTIPTYQGQTNNFDDYAASLLAIEAFELSVRRQEQEARAEYEAEQQRIREEERRREEAARRQREAEARRRREAEEAAAAERRRQESYYSSSSSSSSSSSDSSGGSWGGGSDGSSGGSW